MKIYSGTPIAVGLLAILPAMVQARGGNSYRRREENPNGERTESQESREQRERSERNMNVIHNASLQKTSRRRNLRAGDAQENDGRRKLDKKSSSSESKKGPAFIKTDVLIGGVGYAGAKLGEILAETNDIDFIMLEASDRIGGRLHNIPFGAGEEKYSVELGAQWIDGIEGSPSWELAESSSLRGEFDDFNFEIYDGNGNRDLINEWFEAGSECLAVDSANYASNQASRKCLQLNEGDQILEKNQALCNTLTTDGSPFVPGDIDDLSCEETWARAGGFRVEDRPNPASAKNCQTFYEDFEEGLSANEISANNTYPLYAYVDFGDGDYFVSDDRGFAWLPKTLAANYLSTSVKTEDEIVFDDERLKMNHKITKIKWDPNPKSNKNVQVNACITERVEEPDKPVLYPCKEGRKYRFKFKAKQFISTFPASVLRESIRLELEGVSLEDSEDIAPRFVPPLTESIEGVEALLGYRAGVYNKAFFQFPMKFWSDAHYMLSAKSEGEYVGDFAPIWSNRARLGLNQIESNILQLFTMGDRGYEMDAKPDEEAIAELLPVLNEMFADNIAALYGGPLTREDVEDFYMTRWTQDPLFYGGFDLSHINVTNSEREIFKQRYGNLIFSGAYSCDRHLGWSHGALLAGERTAMNLLKESYEGYEELDTRNICDDGADFESNLLGTLPPTTATTYYPTPGPTSYPTPVPTSEVSEPAEAAAEPASVDI